MDKKTIYAVVCIVAFYVHATSADVCRDIADGFDVDATVQEVNACHECDSQKIAYDTRDSYYEPLTEFTAADVSRLGSPKTAWCGSDAGGDYLEIIFDRIFKINKVVVQGYEIGSWVTSFKVEYDDGTDDFFYIKQDGADMIFQGNNDTCGVEERSFPIPVKAKAVRIHPLTDHNGACMRVDVYACEDTRPIGSTDMVAKSGKSCMLNVLEECDDITCTKYKKDKDGCEICECDDLKVGEIFEGDIEINTVTKIMAEEKFGRKSDEVETDPGHVFKGATKTFSKWLDYRSGGNILIPYQLGGGMSSRAPGAIQDAIAHLAKHTCIRLVRRSSQQYFLNFVGGGGCSSPIGKTRGGNRITIGNGCEYMGIVVHEILHSLGFWHEQSRPDRDDFVRIVFGNIQSGLAYNFNKQPYSAIDSLGSPYDLNSLMHYGGYAFSANRQATIVRRDNNKPVVAQRNGLSKEDIFQINKLYGCDTTGQTTTKPATTTRRTRTTAGPTTTTRRTRPTTTARPTPKPGNCVDDNDNCPGWAIIGECDKNPRYMKVRCKKSCNICSGGTCEDLNQYCPGWKRYCTNQYYSAFMIRNCQFTCGKC